MAKPKRPTNGVDHHYHPEKPDDGSEAAKKRIHREWLKGRLKKPPRPLKKPKGDS